MWWNWKTRTFEGRVASALRVQVSPSAFISLARPRAAEPGPAVVLVSNGPGELTTWVRPLAERLHASLRLRPRSASAAAVLQLVLVPCPNATGQERAAAEPWGL